MFTDLHPFLQTVLGALAGGVGAYIGIRDRLARVEEKIAALHSAQVIGIASVQRVADEAHKRVDNMLMRGHTPGVVSRRQA